MGKCPGITRSGEACRGVVRPGDTYCVAHDPTRAEERKVAASKAGRIKHSQEFREVKAQLRQLANDVLDGKQDKSRASVVAQVLGVWSRVSEAEARLRELEESRIIETNLKVREQMELIGRLEALEEQMATNEKRGGGPWVG